MPGGVAGKSETLTDLHVLPVSGCLLRLSAQVAGHSLAWLCGCTQSGLAIRSRLWQAECDHQAVCIPARSGISMAGQVGRPSGQPGPCAGSPALLWLATPLEAEGNGVRVWVCRRQRENFIGRESKNGAGLRRFHCCRMKAGLHSPELLPHGFGQSRSETTHQSTRPCQTSFPTISKPGVACVRSISNGS